MMDGTGAFRRYFTAHIWQGSREGPLAPRELCGITLEIATTLCPFQNDGQSKASI